MSETSTTPRKRSLSEEELPTFEDSLDMINAVISVLQKPIEPTNVASTYANDKNLATEVQAYAKIAGQDWTYYVRSLNIPIGRNTENSSGSQNSVDIDLGPAKVVSRSHANISYNLDLRYWELKVLGRNGARVDGQKVPFGDKSSTPLHSGAILDIGGTQMMFILPDSPPTVSPRMLSALLSKYKENLSNSKRRGLNVSQSSGINNSSSNTIRSFQMFDRAQLTQSPSSASASSLQNNLDQDLSKEESKDIKPPYSYATMITQAILSNTEGVMSLSEIYNWISSHYAYYKYSKTGWQNSIRHNLSLNKAFEKVPRRPNEPGKGMKWQISESYKEDFLNKVNNGSLSKARRGSSVSRQLQLHLATHHNLPESSKYYGKDDAGNRDVKPSKTGQLIYGQYPTSSIPANIYMNAQPMLNGSVSIPSGRFGYSLQQPSLPYNSQTLAQNESPAFNNISSVKNDFSSPLQSFNDKNTPRFSKIANGPIYSLPPPPHSAPGGSFLTDVQHSSQNQFNHSNGSDISSIQGMSKGSLNTLASSDASSANQISNVVRGNTSNGTSDMALGFTSPKKIAPLEAFTPERGSKASTNKLGIPSGANTNQSSPAFWNFVQFSTPTAQSPTAKTGDQSLLLSPTMNRKLLRESLVKPEKSDVSPLRSKD